MSYKYRAVCKRCAGREWVVVERKQGFFSSWEWWDSVTTLEQADILIRRLSDDTVITAIHKYDKSGERINYSCW